MTLSFCLECIQLAPPSCRPIGKLGALLFSVLDVFLQDILWTSHVKMTCQALGLNNRSLEHPSVKVCCEVELHRHPVRSDSLHCSFSFTFCRLHGTAVWPAFARLINRVLFSNLSLFFFSLSLSLAIPLPFSCHPFPPVHPLGLDIQYFFAKVIDIRQLPARFPS